MLRRRKTAARTETTADPSADATTAAEPPAETLVSTEATGQSTTGATEPLPPVDGPTQGAHENQGRFRSWVTDRAAGYERLTDEESRLLVVHFARKPDSETLEKLKAAGFRYHASYFGQRQVWTRRNDFEGRLRLEEIEGHVRGPAAERVPF